MTALMGSTGTMPLWLPLIIDDDDKNKIDPQPTGNFDKYPGLNGEHFQDPVFQDATPEELAQIYLGILKHNGKTQDCDGDEGVQDLEKDMCQNFVGPLSSNTLNIKKADGTVIKPMLGDYRNVFLSI